MAIFLSQLRHGRYALKGHVFHPFGHLLHRTASHISIDISLTSQLAAQFKEFMGTEAVVLYNAAPVGIDDLLSLFFRADSVFPVIFIRKASARPAKHRNTDLFQRFHNIGTHTIDIRDLGIFSNINSLIDTASQMLGKMPLDLLVDLAQFSVCVDD